jgi:hypothetical protein
MTVGEHLKAADCGMKFKVQQTFTLYGIIQITRRYGAGDINIRADGNAENNSAGLTAIPSIS